MDQDQQTTEVRETNPNTGNTTVRRETVATAPKGPRPSTLAQRIIWYIAGVIVALLTLRIVLLLLAANQDNAFVSLVYSLSGVFAWPFFGIFSYEPTYGQSVFEVSSVVAIIVYALIAAGLAKLFALTSAEGRTV